MPNLKAFEGKHMATRHRNVFEEGLRLSRDVAQEEEPTAGVPVPNRAIGLVNLVQRKAEHCRLRVELGRCEGHVAAARMVDKGELRSTIQGLDDAKAALQVGYCSGMDA